MASTNRDEISRLELLHAAHPDGLVFPHLADAYRRAGRYAQAESVLNAGLRHHADYSSAHVVLGRLRLDQGKRREAKNAFERVLQLDPHNQVALEFLGRLAEEEGRDRDALEFYRRLEALKPGEGASEQVAELERRIGDARRVAAEEEASAEALSGNGGPEARAAGPEESAGGREVELPEPGEVVTETMAELYLRQGLYDRAEAVYRKLSQRNPSNTRLEAKLEEAAELARDARAAGEPEEPERREAPDTAAAGEEQASVWTPYESVSETPSPEAAEPDWLDEAPVATGAPAPSSGIVPYLSGLLEWRSPAAAEPATEEATGEEPDAREPVTAEPDAAEPATGEPVAAEPDAAEPATGEPVAGESTVREPAPQESAAGESAVEEPAAEAPAVEEPAAPASPWEPWAETPATESDLEPEDFAARIPDVPEPEPPAGGEAEEEEPEPADWEWELSRSGRKRAFPGPRPTPAPTAAELGLVEDDLEGINPESKALVALTDLLVGLLEYRDPFFRGSSSLTRLLAMNVAREMGLDPASRVHLALAAVLRDLGRLAMGGRLVETQKTTWTAEARKKIERHVDLALHLMEGIDLPQPVMLAVRYHHERWDGGGYPDGLTGENIPRLARVLAVVDSFAAMVSPRPYRLPKKVPEAIRELEEAAGTQYDPEAVDALVRLLEGRDQPRLGFVQRHRILLVNPDQPGAVVTAAKLCTAGYLAEVASDGDSARERLRRVPIAALVVSAKMGGDAVEALLRDLRLDPLFASLPIVVVDAGSVDLRVRLLEDGADVCFPPAVSHGELQGTLGALVRRTVRSQETRSRTEDDDAPWLALQGDIQDFPLAWLLQVMKYDSRTASVGIRTARDRGAIYIEKGDVVHAQVRDGARGEPALREMLQWDEGRFTVQPDARSRERSIESSIMHLLLTQAVEEDHAAAGVFGAVSDQG